MQLTDTIRILKNSEAGKELLKQAKQLAKQHGEDFKSKPGASGTATHILGPKAGRGRGLSLGQLRDKAEEAGLNPDDPKLAAFLSSL